MVGCNQTEAPTRMRNIALISLPPRYLANKIAINALRVWYQRAHLRARTRLLSIQRVENCAHLERMHDGPVDVDFVMLRNGLSGSTECVQIYVMKTGKDGIPLRGLGPVTGIDIHVCIREHIKRRHQWENWGETICLRICRDVPWLAYVHDQLPYEDVPCDSNTCHHLLGANLVFFIISAKGG